MIEDNQSEPQSNTKVNIHALLARKARHIHQQMMNMPTTPVGKPVYDGFLRRVASYQRAHTTYDYAVIITQCTEAIDTQHIADDMRACYTWLAWVARWQLDAIVAKQ